MFNFNLFIGLCFITLNLAGAAYSKELDILCDRTKWNDGSITENSSQGTISNQRLKLTTLTGIELKPVDKQEFERLTTDDGYPMVYKGRSFAFVFMDEPNLEANNKIKIVQASPHVAASGAWNKYGAKVGLYSNMTECRILD